MQTAGSGDRVKKWINDCILGLAVLVLALVALVYSASLKKSWITVFLARPDVYMAIVLGILTLLALLLVIRALRERKTEAGQERRAPIWTAVPVWTAGILFVYLLLLEKLGFLLDSIWMLWALTFLYSMNSGEEGRNWHNRSAIAREAVKTGLFSVVSSLTMYFVFTKVLSARLPSFDLF